MTGSTSIDQKLSALRREFDQSFALPVADVEAATLDFLAIRVAGDPYAVSLSEIQSLHADCKLVVAPSLLPELLGFSGFRSVLMPVYDLAQLLGYRGGLSARWLVVANSFAPIAFAFGDFDSHLRVTQERVSAPETDESKAAALGGAVQNAGVTLPLLHLPSLVEAIAQRIKAFGPAQGR
ncbi:MAG TPA: chemotaxis protein CheW [Polyangiaceae bacterium]|nr:chemotaxis protein CheW [Polyangiaceae bacterium]